MPGRGSRAATRERSSAALKKKATVNRPQTGYNQRLAAQRNARTVAQAQRAAGVAAPPKPKSKVTAKGYLQNLGSSLAGAASQTLQSFGAAGSAAGRAAANAYNQAVSPYIPGNPQINLPATPMQSAQRRAEDMNKYYYGVGGYFDQALAAAPERSAQFGQRIKPHRPGSSQVWRQNQLLVAPGVEGYTEPAGTPYPGPTAGGYGGYGGYGGGGGYSFPEYGGGGGVYANPQGSGYNPDRASTPRWWHERLTWRF